MDIGSGCWNNITINARWAAFCVNTHTGHLFIPNSDSIGIMPGLNETDLKTHINFCLVSRTLVEIAGWLHRDQNHPLMPYVRKACCCPKNGEDVFFGDFDFSTTDAIPSVWYLKSPHFSTVDACDCLPVRTFAVFNWDDQKEQTIKIKPATLRLAEGRYFLKDFWSDGLLEMTSSVAFVLKPHESRMFSVLPAMVAHGIIDADCRIESLSTGHGGLDLRVETAVVGNNITVKGIPRKVMIGGQAVDAGIRCIGLDCAILPVSGAGLVDVNISF